MKRDMDIVRAIAIAVANSDTAPLNGIEGIESTDFARHAQWMQEAGLVQAALLPKDSMQPARTAMIWRLTWAGCEFADAVRSDTLWHKAKETVLKPSASWTFGLLTDWLKAQLAEQIGQITS
jgi:hypothetical protein